jgi:hypothetical protein
LDHGTSPTGMHPYGWLADSVKQKPRPPAASPLVGEGPGAG